MKRYLVGSILLVAILILVLGIVSSSFAQKKYNEAPMLAELVAAGKLPPVEQRLPKNPEVMPVLKEIGTYGGTLRFAELGWQVNVCFANLENLIGSWPVFSDNLFPSLVESYEASADATTFTFRLREGMKWSDGVPVTTEDVLFKWEDVLLNKDLTPVFPADLKVKGKEPTLDVIDKYTFRIKFPSSYGSFPALLSYHYNHYTMLMLPKHYMKQFHPRYTPMDKLEPLIKQEGYEKGEWWKLFNRKADGLLTWHVNADVGAPVLTPWMIEKLVSPTIRTFVRNPYYWKVDRAGNQLPYIDKLYAELFKDSKLILPKVIAGEVDLQPEMIKFSDLPIVNQYARKGGYKIMIFQNWMSTWVEYFPNLTYTEDPVWRKIINDVRFRQALSLAIDRKNISATIFLGYADPEQGQASLLPDSRYMVPGAVGAYTEYDPERANRLLDEMGLKRGPDGIRIRPDGKKLTLPIEFFEVNPYGVPVTEMVVKYWRDIGIDATMKVVLSSLWFQNEAANKNIMSVWHAAGVTDKEFRVGKCERIIPNATWASFGPLWARWYVTDGKEGEEPPKEIKDLLKWGDTLKLSSDPQEVLEAGRGIVRSQMENLWRIGAAGSAPVVCIINEKLGNMPEKSPDPTVLTMSTNFIVEQAFFKK
ncbi:MAG: ABC transporter substrate-binding protein [bacterium]